MSKRYRTGTGVSIKPHHFVDILASLGAGEEFKPHPCGHAVHSVAENILGNREINLRIELGADDICLPCRHNINGLCDDTIDTSFRPSAPESKREWNLVIDRRWCEKLGIRQDDILKARHLCLRIGACLDEIEDIYMENPPSRTAAKRDNLKNGTARFLE